MKGKNILRFLVALLVLLVLKALDIISVPQLYIPPGFEIILILFIVFIILFFSRMVV